MFRGDNVTPNHSQTDDATEKSGARHQSSWIRSSTQSHDRMNHIHTKRVRDTLHCRDRRTAADTTDSTENRPDESCEPTPIGIRNMTDRASTGEAKRQNPQKFNPRTRKSPRCGAIYLARLRKPARFHLELTAPGVSGGQVLPHNDRSRRALARGRTGCDVRKRDKGDTERPEKKSQLFSRISLLIPKKRSRFRVFGERDCTRRDAVFLRDGETGQGRGRISVGGGGKSHSRAWADPTANSREGLMRVARGWLVKNDETREK